jgi:ankyrin repeat protein
LEKTILPNFSTKLKHIISADNNGRTPLHLAAFSDVSDSRMLSSLLPNSNVLPSFNAEQLLTMIDLNGRNVLEMAKLHNSAFQEWKRILNLDED